MAKTVNPDNMVRERKTTGTRPALSKADSENTTYQMPGQGIGESVEEKKESSAENGIPIAEKVLLTLKEAALLTGIGQNKLREISDADNCPFVLWNGSKRMFKRENLIQFLYSAFSI